MKLYRALPPDEYQFDFLVSVEGGCYSQEVLARGGRIFAIPERRKDFPGACRGIYRTVKENQYDVVLKLAENSLAVTDLVAAKLGGAKTLAVRSCNAPTGMSRAGRSVHTLLKPLLNAVSTVKLAPSDLAAAFMFGKRTAEKRAHLLHNGVDLTVFRYDAEGKAEIRREFGLEGKLVVGHVGRFHKQKNHRFLLEVFAKIRARREDAVLLLVGTGDLEDQIRQQICDLGLEDAVIFTGQRFDIPRLLSAMDVFVFPSFHEGMPNTVIEAQATGLPCVIADTITREADITGLVQYLSLERTPEDWARTALSAVNGERVDTTQAFMDHGYDIERVAKELMQLLGC
jgi:glycosyltransferase involved in cell wall biosynthesis